MLELIGKYNKAIIYTDNIEETAVEQIITLCNQEFTKDSNIRIMPDVHAGAGCTIGTTMTITDKIVPNLVGVDIGCGMLVIVLDADNKIIPEALDLVIDRYVPAGFSVNKSSHLFADFIEIDKLKCVDHINMERAMLSVGTLGGGNHFIELNEDGEGNQYLVVHTGSRNLGKQVAEYYQNVAFETLNLSKDVRDNIIATLKAAGRATEIEAILKDMEIPTFTKELAYLEGVNLENYLHDIKIVQEYASFNRRAIVNTIFTYLERGFQPTHMFETIHNYIDLDNNILRKGAVSAQKDELLIVPMNMRDGSLICVGKGNEDWNCSAPHGAGRIMSRSKAKELVTLEEYEASMEGIYTTSVNKSTLDESPMAYKPMAEIISNIGETVEIKHIIKPIYNFKAGEQERRR